jgi:hypothetical protein
MAFTDGFHDNSKIDIVHSTGYLFDARQLVCQSRSQGTTYMAEYCTSLGAWNVHTGGTASIDAIVIGQGGTNNPAGSAAFQFSTGATLNSQCAISQALPILPVSYGVFVLFALPAVDDQTGDALNVVIQDSISNKAMSLLFCKDEVLIGAADGSYASLSTHSPPYICENWFENKSNDDGTNTISLWQGAQFISSVTLILPTGPAANAGLVYISQQSATTPNQISQIAGMNIGITQLPDAGLVQSVPYVVPFNAQAINVLFKVEDVCNDVVLGTDFTAALIINGVEQSITLLDLGSYGFGIIDYTKPVRYFWGGMTAAIAQGATIAYKAHMLNGKFMAILSVSFELTSIY